MSVTACCLAAKFHLRPSAFFAGFRAVVLGVIMAMAKADWFILPAVCVGILSGAQSAELPSAKAGPARLAQVCRAHGEGFFYLPGSDICLRLGGSVRAEYQFVPSKVSIDIATGAPAAAMDSSSSSLSYVSDKLQSTTGFESRAVVEIDARAPTSMGLARTLVRMRVTAKSGLATSEGGANGYSVRSNTTSGVNNDAAMVQWAGLTMGQGPQNYAMMPLHFYHGTPWANFQNGVKQLAYTARLGDQVTSTLALEDPRDHMLSASPLFNAPQYAKLVGNLRWDGDWGFAAIHGLLGKLPYYMQATGIVPTSSSSGVLALGTASSADAGSKLGYALGATASFRLPMIAPGDQLWLTINRANGELSAILTDGILSNISNFNTHRLMGGVVRFDPNIMPVMVKGYNAVETVNAWNAAAAFTHYWAADWRSNIMAGYVEINPPRQMQTTVTAWGKGQLQTAAASLIYSPVRDFDIGLELEYGRIKSSVQNPTTAFLKAGMPGLMESNISTKLRVERNF